MTEFQQLVRDFNLAVKSPRSSDLRKALIREEAKETTEAILRQDPVETLDGLCDLLYVTYGAGDCFDIPLDTPMAELLPGQPLGWARLKESIPIFEKSVSRCLFALDALEDPESLNHLKNCLETLADKCWVTSSQGLGVDLRPFFREVHRTNMHKLKGPKREDGKQLKPPDWQPPRIAEMYEALGKREL